MINKGLFSKLYIDDVRSKQKLDDQGEGRMATLTQAWREKRSSCMESLWDSFVKKALGYLEFVSPSTPQNKNGLLPLYDDWDFANCICVLCLVGPTENIDDKRLGRFWPGKLIAELKKRKLHWGILTDGDSWRLYSTKSSKPFEDYVELDLVTSLKNKDELEYALFEHFFHADSFLAEEEDDQEEAKKEKEAGVYKCQLDRNREKSENILESKVKSPFLFQVDEVLQYLCNGFIHDTRKSGEEYTEDERREIFESAVKLLYRCLFLFYAESRSLLPSKQEKEQEYGERSIRALCQEAHKFRWGTRNDHEEYGMWKHLKGLTNAVNDGDPDYGIIGYNGGLFDDEEERFLGHHRIRNDFLSRALYLLAFVEPEDADPNHEYKIPYEDLEVRHLGELYENILEFNVTLADADRVRRRVKNGVEILLLSETEVKKGDTVIKKGDVYFGETALERKQSGSYYTPESLVQFLNDKAIVQPLAERFAKNRERFSEFLKQVGKDYDQSTRRGALQSAIALVERFVQEEVFNFKVCDPAMGSGHFLVNAANQMTELIIGLLDELPLCEETEFSISCDPNYWRRLVTRHCVYGVDINPLSTHLAKLSLWLNCFARDHKLTFLDHHLRCGNSLIGVRTFQQLQNIPQRNNEREKKSAQADSLPFTSQLEGRLNSASQTIADIARIDEDDTDRQKDLFEEAYSTAVEYIAPLADLHTAYLIDNSISKDDYWALFGAITKGELDTIKSNPELKEIWQRIAKLQNGHDFFHWMLEFPDVFSISDKLGFSAIVGNPPWDMVTAQPAEFFGKYEPCFRSLSRTESLRKIDELCKIHSEIALGWEQHKNSFIEANSIFNEKYEYPYGPKGRNNLYHYFLHRSYDILQSKGNVGIVLPGSFNADKGASSLRKLFFEKCNILTFFCFSNEKFIFKNVHHAFRFIVFSASKSKKTTRFRICFLTDPREAVHPSILDGKLRYLDGNSLQMTYESVKKLSPDKKNILEFKRQQDVNLVEHLYSVAEPLKEFSEHINFRFSIEMMSNNDAWRFDGASSSDIPVYAGRCFHQYDDRLIDTISFIPEHMLEEMYINETFSPWKRYRLVFRDVTGGTNERTCISTILPPKNACVETARILYLETQRNLPAEQLQAYILSVLNSFCFDYVIRFMVRSHLSQHIMEGAPILKQPQNDIFNVLAAKVSRLICIEESFNQFWRNCFTNEWQKPTFWYSNKAPIDNYGPKFEQDIRKRLRDESLLLSKEWSVDCGVYDRMDDRRDIGNRAQIRAEIDAYIAHNYGLSRKNFHYILDTFHALKKKEERIFGEYISKRKCLEEYDRIAQIL